MYERNYRIPFRFTVFFIVFAISILALGKYFVNLKDSYTPNEVFFCIGLFVSFFVSLNILSILWFNEEFHSDSKLFREEIKNHIYLENEKMFLKMTTLLEKEQ